MTETELYHYGIKRRSGRYPYGSGERPFQSSGGGFTKQVRVRKQENHEKEKERVLREGTATEILKFRGELTKQQLIEAAERIRLTSTLESYSQKEFSRVVRKVDKAMSRVKMTTGWVKTGTDVYNTLAMVYNATAEGKKNPLPFITKG